MKTQIIAEIGINFAYGNDKSKFLDNAKKLIDVACVAGCDYVKFQKRDPDVCVPEAEKLKAKRVPWREEETTYLQYKYDIEFGQSEYDEIHKYCREKGIGWFASVWDKNSVDFMKRYSTHFMMENEEQNPAIVMKIPSALITDIDLCEYARENCNYLIVSTGMSTEEEIEECVRNCFPNVIMHTNSSYPSKNEELRLDYIQYLKHKWGNSAEVGYSGHEFGLMTTIAATVIGAKWIERHITLDRTLWGSDQMASVEPQGLIKLVKSIRDIENARGGFEPRAVFGSELDKRKSLRGK